MSYQSQNTGLLGYGVMVNTNASEAEVMGSSPVIPTKYENRWETKKVNDLIYVEALYKHFRLIARFYWSRQ